MTRACAGSSARLTVAGWSIGALWRAAPGEASSRHALPSRPAAIHRRAPLAKAFHID